jgi:hypothetical protein
MRKPSSKQLKHPVPDVASATREVLRKTADWMERARDEDLFGSRPTHVNQAVALQEARALAVAYVRKGAQS